MTQETYQLAHRLIHDLSILKEIKVEQQKRHWVGFRVAFNDSIDSFWTDELKNDFQEFIEREIEKANRIFDEL